MHKSKVLSAALFAAAVIVTTPAVNAQAVVEVLGAGSSAMWQTAALGAYNTLAGSGGGHFTVKGSCTSGNCAEIVDSRSPSILPEAGNLWVVWNAAQTEVWAYLSVDSVVGNRSYFAQPRTTLQIDPETETGSGFSTNLISSNLWGPDAANLPTAVYAALNKATITTAFTDIRPEDAKFASCRTLNELETSTYLGLGYGTGTTCSTLIGTQILSAFSSTVANPVNFNIKGTDPFSGESIKPYATVDVGASPIVFIVNRSNPNGLGYGGAGTPVITNLTAPIAQMLWNGTECDTNVFAAAGPPTDTPVYVMQREPMSGTMNTTEFTTFRCGQTGTVPAGYCDITGAHSQYNSQEKNVVPPPQGTTNANNPLNLACTAGGGTRRRAIGTSEMVGTAVFNNADAIGYTFWGYGNVSKLAGNLNYGYLTLNGVDGIQASYTNGELPVCISSNGISGVCPLPAGTSLPNVRNGTYTAWSVLRVVADAGSTALTNTKKLVSAIESNVNSTVPDFVPFNKLSPEEPGLTLYREHFTQSGVAANNGLNGNRESGGDVGGCIMPKPATGDGVTGCRQ
jgi:ABC-type phosphate transport system substrate-binding protein